mmetsp:Transcript_127708/g.367571  ORF Transcript_127708/g.367571 Transcript_127708/m.367571 type:complete len:354 (-) Transcript_127708:140-1201(-)
MYWKRPLVGMHVPGKKQVSTAHVQQRFRHVPQVRCGQLLVRLVHCRSVLPRRVRQNDQEGRGCPVHLHHLGAQPLLLLGALRRLCVCIQGDDVHRAKPHGVEGASEIVADLEVVRRLVVDREVVRHLLRPYHGRLPPPPVGQVGLAGQSIRFELMVTRNDEPREVRATAFVEEAAECVPLRRDALGVSQVPEEHPGVERVDGMGRRDALARIPTVVGLAQVTNDGQTQPRGARRGRRSEEAPLGGVCAFLDTVSVALQRRHRRVGMQQQRTRVRLGAGRLSAVPRRSLVLVCLRHGTDGPQRRREGRAHVVDLLDGQARLLAGGAGPRDHNLVSGCDGHMQLLGVSAGRRRRG